MQLIRRGTMNQIRRRLPPIAIVAVVIAVAAGSARADAASAPDNPIRFCAALSDAEESVPTYSDGRGRGVFTLSRADLTFTWDVAFRGLSGPVVAANAHGPQRPGANASALFPLATASAPASPLKGSIVLSEGQLKYLLNARIYVNLTTAKYPAGEIRGQVQRVLPGTACPELK